jgi:hypothetical protein
MSGGALVAIAIVGAGLALLIAKMLRHRRARREAADLPRLTSIHEQCNDLMGTLDRYSRGSNATTIRVSRSIADQFRIALVDAQSIHDPDVRNQAVAALDIRFASEGSDWVDIADPRHLHRMLSDLRSVLNQHIDPALRHYNAERSRVPGKARKLRKRLLGSTGGERWV